MNDTIEKMQEIISFSENKSADPPLVINCLGGLIYIDLETTHILIKE